MKSIIGPAIAAIIIASAGLLAYSAGKEETRLTDAHRELLLLQYAEARTDGEKLGDSPALARVPGLGRETATDAKELRATASYWNNDYASLAPQKDTSGTVT